MSIMPDNEGHVKVGQVTPEERDEIKSLYERKNGITELFRSLVSVEAADLEKSKLYERLVKDMGDISIKFQNWWDEKAKKYSWEGRPGFKWQIDFNSRDIFMIKE